MEPMDNILEERLARLEAGESLEACLTDLPEEEALLLKKAAMLNSLAASAPISNKLANRRHELLRLAKENIMKPSRPSTVLNKAQPRWVLPAALAGGAFAVLTFIVIFSLVVSLVGPGLLRSWSQPRGVAQQVSNPQSALLKDARGLVEVQDTSGVWKVARVGQTMEAGQHIRTGALSSVTLSFYDGSQTQLGPESELSIDELNAQKSGPRIIVLTQTLGESQHDVSKSHDPASRYEVHTASGVGTAKGTSFRVFVTVAMLVRFEVNEGAVAVTNLDTTVLVVAGQTTVIVFGQAPAQPVFHMSGEGKIEQTGSVWHIAGRTFRIDSNTELIGNPMIGDLVSFDARIVLDGSPILDRVVLLSLTPGNRFSFTGTVDSLGADGWTIAGKAVQVDATTTIDTGIQVGDTVEVQGVVLEGGVLLAANIHLLKESQPFEFVGVVDEVGVSEWKISGIAVSVDGDTNIQTGLVAGDVVHVRGQIKNGTWLARSIERAEENEREFSVTGEVEGMDPWMVAGLSFDTNERTEIDTGIAVGDKVKVEGHILEDGQWLAGEIQRLDTTKPQQFEFTGTVKTMNPWDVDGITFTTDEHTVVDSQIAVDDLVHVKGLILPDGTWLAESIKRLNNDLGCLDFSTMVRQMEDTRIIMLDWHAIQLGDEVEVEGKINVNAVIIVSGCTQQDGSFVITHIIVIYQLDSLPVIIQPPSNSNDNDDDDEDDDD